MRTTLFALWIALLSLSFLAQAKPCGGKTACACGDKVTASYQLRSDLICTSDTGLTIAANNIIVDGKKADGGFYKVQSSRRPTNKDNYGVVISNGITNATIQNIHITGFARGIHVQDADRNIIKNNLLEANGFDRDERGQPVKPAGYGIDLADGASHNQIINNEIKDNFDEGLHLGTGPEGTFNVIEGNTFENNGEENLYLLNSPQTQVTKNTFRGARQNSIYIKNSSKCEISENKINDRPIALEGASHGNVLKDNAFTNAAIVLDKNKGAFPANNNVIGGSFDPSSLCEKTKQRFNDAGNGNRHSGLPCP